MRLPPNAGPAGRRHVCTRVRGGVGNQLFIYATARALARRHDAELWLDATSALGRDRRRTFVLDAFAIRGRIAPPDSFFVSTPRWRRTPIRWCSRLLPWSRRRYLEQPWLRYVPQLPGLKLRHDVYLDGFWQHENYFADCAAELRAELVLRAAPGPEDQAWLARIRRGPAVAVHVRRTDSPVFLPLSYYANALARLDLPGAACFVFSDDIAWARENIRLPGEVAFVGSSGPRGELDDFRLMTACTHFIAANSTYSWWAAWLGAAPGKRVLVPVPNHEWGQAPALPAAWERIPLA